LDLTKTNQSLSIKSLNQQMTFHGDPSVRLNPHSGPDYICDFESARLVTEWLIWFSLWQMTKIQMPIQRATFEFVIIVMGVLAAFAVENWRESRAEAALEAEYVERLLSDVALDIETLQFTLGLAEQKIGGLREVRNWNRNNPPSPEHLVKILSRSLNLGWSLPRLNTATFEDLNSTGRLGLIKDIELRRAILDYYRNLSNARERLERRMTPFPTYIYSIMAPELLTDDEDELATALKMCAEICKTTIDAVETTEFHRLATAEANYARNVVRLLPDVREQALVLQSQLLAFTD
jgi:hypothetical protein